MTLTSKKTSLIILALTALISSRAMFAFFDDPEGPNLLIVTVLAAILFVISGAVLSFLSPTTGVKKIGIGIFIQILLVTILYFFL